MLDFIENQPAATQLLSQSAEAKLNAEKQKQATSFGDITGHLIKIFRGKEWKFIRLGKILPVWVRLGLFLINTSKIPITTTNFDDKRMIPSRYF